MGYYTSMTGELQIEPPAKWSEIKDSLYLQVGKELFHIEVEEVEVVCDEGLLITKRGVAVIPYEEGTKAYTVDEDLKELVDSLPGHKFVGCIEGEGEENSDMWRLYVRNGKVIKHTVRAQWPDAPEED